MNFIEKENENNKIRAECILSNETENKIPCYLGEEVNKNFSLDSYIGSQEQNLFLITQENKANNLLLTCLKEKEKDNKVITIVVIVIIVIFIAVIILLVTLRKKQTPQEIDIKNIKPEKDDFVFYIDNNDIRSMSSRSNSEKSSSLNFKRKNNKKNS